MTDEFKGYEDWSRGLETANQENEYRFSVGDGVGGAVGLCFSLRGATPAEALKQLMTFIEGWPDDGFDIDLPAPLLGARLYLNPEHIGAREISEKMEIVTVKGER